MKFQSKLAQADASQLLAHLIHPSVFALLSMPLPLPAAEGCETNGVLTLTFTSSKGHIVLRNDGIRILIEAFYGNMPVLRCALRDRQLDGTDVASPLTFFPNIDPACNRLPAPDFLAAELSIYSWDPNTYLDGLDVEGTIGHFIADPDHYLWRQYDRSTFMTLWEQIFFLGRAPWQTARPMPGVATHFVKQAMAFLKGLGYHRVDAVPSWFNVAKFFKKLGFQFTYGEHQSVFDAILYGLKSFPSLNHTQQAWLVALQNVPEGDLPAEFKLPCRWPVTHTNMYWVRMHVDLNPYPAKATSTSKLMEKITSFKVTPPQADALVLHTGHTCPCMHTLGASSPSASGPAATAPIDEKPTQGGLGN